jgi:16S rRNA (adenine1518-N6/adenine1519-N6)-dimethyltransferase
MVVRLDQHTMVDKAIIRKIVEFAEIGPNEAILEIGAGTGSLTRELASKSKNIIAVEIDKKYAAELKKIENVKVIRGNALKEMKEITFDKLVANLPYAICEPLIWKLVGIDFKLAVLTIPKGFADILTAKKGEKTYSKISILARECFDVAVLFNVPREAFDPPPKTDSVVVKMTPKQGNSIQKEVLKRQQLKVKNAVMRALFLVKKSTKNQARKDIKTLKLNNTLLEKRLFDADINELDTVLHALKKLFI